MHCIPRQTSCGLPASSSQTFGTAPSSCAPWGRGIPKLRHSATPPTLQLCLPPPSPLLAGCVLRAGQGLGLLHWRWLHPLVQFLLHLLQQTYSVVSTHIPSPPSHPHPWRMQPTSAHNSFRTLVKAVYPGGQGALTCQQPSCLLAQVL